MQWPPNWEVFTELSDLQIQLHWATATIAFLLGLIIFSLPKGTVPHKTMGAIYAVLMITTAIAAFFVRRGDVSGLDYLSLKGMTWIHIFVPLTLFGIFGGLWGILVKKDRRAHSGPLIGSYIGALIIAGALTFLPGRRMQLFFFGEPERIDELVEEYGRGASLIGDLLAVLVQ
ncbi:DUF2306 domain-containing protein [Aquisalinus flavus]|uniref:Membrane protein n=1 Tax=Aquisalinus flavus TaxID=1526572 RepID=A0A8J2Y7Z4_9PROT|nr:DUF2306 domain-containing protein [Aquisalinus flavus]MBD0426186.1 DUF2306 domain-containing protein [Aquisalinus flavus]UNE48240.1 DUF2306 domain-containing protein [Aquisalinus flavus]GGD09894.1 membrane protein [Aquisalinus flavus]